MCHLLISNEGLINVDRKVLLSILKNIKEIRSMLFWDKVESGRYLTLFASPPELQ